MRMPGSVALARVPTTIFPRNARVARRLYTEYRPAGTPRTSARNLTLSGGRCTPQSLHGSLYTTGKHPFCIDAFPNHLCR